MIELISLVAIVASAAASVQGATVLVTGGRAQARSDDLKDPRRHALTRLDALFEISDVRFDRGRGGLLRRLADLDGDGLGDLAVLRQGDKLPRRVDAVSSADGSTIRTLWTASGRSYVAWDAGGEVDGDGVPDLLVRRREGRSAAEAVEVVSGGTGSVLHRHEIAPRGVACFLEDCDDDGRTDYVVVDRGSVVAYSGKSGSVLWRAEPSAKRVGRREYERCALVGDLDGDGLSDVVVSAEETGRVLAGADGAELRKLDARVFQESVRAAWTRAGDVNGDGVQDLLVDEDSPGLGGMSPGVGVVSGRSFELMFSVRYPGGLSEYAVAAAVGDIDGDGYDDIALGDANLNLGEGGTDTEANVERARRELLAASLSEALRMESRPWMSGNWESGCAVVYSGRTCRAILGVWGTPYSRDGMGLQVVGLPDVTGDGLPDVLVADDSRAYAFAGAATR